MRREARPPDYTCVRSCAASIYDRLRRGDSPNRFDQAKCASRRSPCSSRSRRAQRSRPTSRRRLLGHAARPPAASFLQFEAASSVQQPRPASGGGGARRTARRRGRGARGAGDAHTHLRPARALHHRLRRRERRRQRRARRPAGGAVEAGGRGRASSTTQRRRSTRCSARRPPSAASGATGTTSARPATRWWRRSSSSSSKITGWASRTRYGAACARVCVDAAPLPAYSSPPPARSPSPGHLRRMEDSFCDNFLPFYRSGCQWILSYKYASITPMLLFMAPYDICMMERMCFGTTGSPRRRRATLLPAGHHHHRHRHRHRHRRQNHRRRRCRRRHRSRRRQHRRR